MNDHAPADALSRARRADHAVLFYEEEGFPAAAIAAHLHEGLAAGGGALVVATIDHRRALRQCLASLGAEVDLLEGSGRLVMLDAEETLKAIMVRGLPDRERFLAVVGAAVDGTRAATPEVPCHAFGEMVCLLVDQGAVAAAIMLEELWDAFLETRASRLHCAYRLTQFAEPSLAGAFDRICDIHGTVIPVPSCDDGHDTARRLAGMQRRAHVLQAAVSERRLSEEALKRHRDQLDALVRARTEELRIAKEKAEVASEAKSAFLAQISHELRTPLNSVLGHAQLLQRESGMSSRAMARLQSIMESGQHLLALINDLLDLAKIDAGKMALCPVPLNPTVLLTAIANIVRVRAEEKNLSFRCRLPYGLPGAISADDRRLRQVLLNLLVNAVKFTDRGKVSLAVALLGGSAHEVRLRFEVVDTGIGIAPEHQEIIFLPFEQVGDAARRGGGTGLGLAISRQLVRLMGSELRVDSTPGKGTRFWFELRCPVLEGTLPNGPHHEPVFGYAGRRRKILVADDIADNREVLTDLLHGLGFEVAEASNGRELLAQVRAAQPDLVIVDLVMPVMGGLEAICHLRRDSGLDELPIIAVSASANAVDRRASLAAGADAFLMKPIDADLLLRRVGELLSLSWYYADRGGEPADEPLVLPPREQIETLRKLALIGNMRSIHDYASELVERDPRYSGFAGRLDRLARSYQSKAILALVNEQLAAARPLP